MTEDLHSHGYFRIGVASHELVVGDVEHNFRQIAEIVTQFTDMNCDVAVLPEMAVTGYTIGDLVLQDRLLDQANHAVSRLADHSKGMKTLFVIGAPLQSDGKIYNCAVAINDGNILGVVPKSYLPTYGEFYEKRWFAEGRSFPGTTIHCGGKSVPCGTDIIFSCDNFEELKVGIEICEDLWSVTPPSNRLVSCGATLIVNPSASNEIVGKQQYRRKLIEMHSATCLAGYAYASSGPNESSTDTVYSGYGCVAEVGSILTELDRFKFSAQSAVVDLDCGRIVSERRINSTFETSSDGYRQIPFCINSTLYDAAPRQREIQRKPFIPNNPETLHSVCQEILDIQAAALAKRLLAIKSEQAIIGISGGLDSTLALIATVCAFEALEIPLTNILGVSMPGPGTSTRTYNNARNVCSELGTSFLEIDINDAINLHLKDIKHTDHNFDVTFENTQARERTQILMNLANKHGGIVVGTGDLSETALGWSTYSGDHISMYHVNVGVPKTLVRHLVDWYARHISDVRGRTTLLDILDTPISPELIPPQQKDDPEQKTEEIVGPYELNDFFLYYAIRHAFDPQKILFLASCAFKGDLDQDEISSHLKAFYKRFFAAQFKRSCATDGPKIGTVSLSPRADWRMPSDAAAALWLSALD